MTELRRYCNACGVDCTTEHYSITAHSVKLDEKHDRYNLGRNSYARLCKECFVVLNGGINWEE